jgi:REP element-mobilizing transposase RayT
MDRKNFSNRKTTRLRDYDYRQFGAYYVTICSQNKKSIFGEVINGQMMSNEIGNIVVSCWQRLPRFFNIKLGTWMIMPNHFHAIIWILSASVSILDKDQKGGVASGSLGAIIQNFKSVSTRKINKFQKTPGLKIWQYGFYDRVIRNDEELERISEYILFNPDRWEIERRQSYGR